MLNDPVATKDVSKFEQKNNISVNVYSIEEKKKLSLDLTQEEPFIFGSDVAAPKKKYRRARCTFIEDEDDDDDEDDRGLEDFIDNEELSNDISFYCTLRHQHFIHEG